MQGLLKLPTWTGHVYRGETLTKPDFDKRFGSEKRGKFKPQEKSFRRSTISSATKDVGIAVSYSTGGTHLTERGVPVVWDMEVTNGRDIEAFSSWTKEKEVALLPGAEFAILSAEYQMKNRVFVKCKQRK
jgi:hypothetical protein